jgi:hypothetical protein
LGEPDEDMNEFTYEVDMASKFIRTGLASIAIIAGFPCTIACADAGLIIANCNKLWR